MIDSLFRRHWLEQFIALNLLIFCAFTIIFAADLWHDFQANREAFVVRLAVHEGLSFLAAAIATIVLARRKQVWSVQGNGLMLERWGKLSGQHSVRSLSLQESSSAHAMLFANLKNGEQIVLSVGRLHEVQALHDRLAQQLDLHADGP